MAAAVLSAAFANVVQAADRIYKNFAQNFFERAVRAGLCASRVGAHRGLPGGADRARVPAPMLKCIRLVTAQPTQGKRQQRATSHPFVTHRDGMIGSGFDYDFEKIGDPDRNRTCDLQIRNLPLYPTELRDRAPRHIAASECFANPVLEWDEVATGMGNNGPLESGGGWLRWWPWPRQAASSVSASLTQ